MKAIVCDKCGKVIPLEDDWPCRYPAGAYRLVNDRAEAKPIDLCEECVGELVKCLRKMDGDSHD